MRRRTIWIIVAVVVVAIGIAIGVAVWANSPSPEGSTPAPTEATATGSPTPDPTPPATPTPSPTDMDATCENTTTEEFRALAEQQGWTAKNTTDDETGAKPFDAFPGGMPEGAIVCRWADDPDAPTDTVTDLAWTPLDPLLTEDAQLVLIDLGYERTEGPEGALFELAGGGDAYLFTGPDVRWAMTVDDLAWITAPGGD